MNAYNEITENGREFENQFEYDAWDERAAIMEYDSGLPRFVAERIAYEDIVRIRKYEKHI